MNINKYQELARQTAIYPSEYKIVYPALGLCGESGEVAEKVKKFIRDDKGELTASKVFEIMKEMGDVLWYLANLASDLGIDLQDVATVNIQKLQNRKIKNALSGSGDNR